MGKRSIFVNASRAVLMGSSSIFWLESTGPSSGNLLIKLKIAWIINAQTTL